MRILHTEWSTGYGGQERRVILECRGLKEKGHYIALACRAEAKIRDWAQKEGLDVFTIPFRNAFDIGSIFKLVKIIKENNIEIVNTHSGIDSWCSGIAAKLSRVPVLIRTRHLNLPLKRNIFNFIHYFPDMIITCGENMRINLIENCGFPPKKLISIPTGVEEKFFKIKRDMQNKVNYGIKESSPVIVNVGILRSVKGHEITLKAFKLVSEIIPEAILMLVGDGPSKQKLINEVKDLNLNKKVIFTGFLEDPSEIFSFADVNVISSWSEGLPQSLLQALAAGVPTVATAVGGIPEVLINNETGITVEPGDYKSISEAILKILKNYEWACDMTRKGREILIEKYSEDVMIGKLEDLYYELLEQKSKVF